MDFEWNEEKYRTNLVKHRVRFEMAQSFLWSEANIEPDLRRDYGEDRFIARGYADDGFAYHIAFTMRTAKIRIISMRRFNQKDYVRYGT